MTMSTTHEARRPRWLTKLAASVAVATATAMTLAGPAHAATYPASTADQATTSGTYSDGTSAPAAPTANLANLSRNMRVASQGVSEPGAQVRREGAADVDHEILRAAPPDDALRARDVGLRAAADREARETEVERRGFCQQLFRALARDRERLAARGDVDHRAVDAG